MADEVDLANTLFEDRRAVEIKAISRMLERTNPSVECVDCGEDIDAARRKALPSAVRCMRCQEEAETRHRLYRN
jgi:phage/conjugal plasmid C-4 type zinc finger TraR family protein